MLNLNSKIFKSYDIRGIYPGDLNGQVAFLIGRAFARKTKAKEVVVGRDMRLGGGVLKNNLIKGLAAGGVKKIINLELVPIDGMYFGVTKLNYETGIMITASHNPKEYNGFKMVDGNKNIVRGVDLWLIVQKINSKLPSTQAKIIKKNIYPAYLKHILSFIELKNIKPLKVVIDAGNGLAGKVMPLLEKHLPIKMIKMNFELDGNFPAHPSNPLDPKSQIGIAQKIKAVKADFGVIFDGDTDRLFFVDEKGQFIPADITLLLLAKLFLNREPGKGVAYNLICSKIVPEKIIEYGGRPIRTAVGFVNVAEGLKKHDGILGGEVSAHYSFRDNGYFDSGFIAFLILLELLSQENKKLSELIRPYFKYFKLPETNYEVHDINKKIAAVKNKYNNYQQDYLDGVTVDNWGSKDGWWLNIRPSNTEPLLRVNVEAKKKITALKIKKEILALIKNN